MHPLVAPVLLRMPRLSALDLNPQPEPPHRELTEPIQPRRCRERDPVIGPHRLGQPEFFEGPLEHREGEFFLGRRQRLARQQVATGKVGDRQRIAVPPIAKHELALVVGAPEYVGLGRVRQRRPGRGRPPASPPLHEAVPIEDSVNGADRGQVWRRKLLAQFLADLRRAPPGILPLQPNDRRFDRCRQPIGLAIRALAAIGQRLESTILVAVENLVARLPRDPERSAQGRHLLALEQAGDKPEPLVHDVTLLPRHAPSCRRGKVSPMCPEYGVTYLSGRTVEGAAFVSGGGSTCPISLGFGWIAGKPRPGAVPALCSYPSTQKLFR